MQQKVLSAAIACLSLMGLVACGAPAAPAVSAPGSTTPAPSAEPFGDPCNLPHDDEVGVGDAATLASALAGAEPGQLIRLAAGTYSGNFVIEASGTAALPIVLCGPREAVLQGDGIDAGYVLHLDGTSYVIVSGLTLTRAKKGLVLDGARHTLLTGLLVHTVGQEAIQIRRLSSDNVVARSELRDTGKLVAAYGDGVHVGSSFGQWDDAGTPDRSDRNQILDNAIGPRVTGEPIDIKEGTSGGLIRGNAFDGTGMTAGSAWVDLKGNGYRVEDNVGAYAPADGFQVHAALDGWGNDNAFDGNRAAVNGPGFGFNVGPGTRGTVVSCGNQVEGAASGFANVACGVVAEIPAPPDGGDTAPPAEETPPPEEVPPSEEPPSAETPPPATSLDPALPPSGNFDLTHWYLTLPSGSTVQPSQLSDGYALENVFFTDPATGGMVFRCPNLAGTTANSSYSRTELREMRAGGGSAKDDVNNWIPEEGGTLRATLRVDRVSVTGDSYKVGRVVIGQIHGVDSEPLRLYYDKKPGQAKGRIYGGMDTASNVGSWTPDIVPNTDGHGIALGETFGYEIRLLDVHLTVVIRTQGGDYTFTRDIDPNYRGENQYFKAGVYNQNNTGESSDYVKATFFDLRVTHP